MFGQDLCSICVSTCLDAYAGCAKSRLPKCAFVCLSCFDMSLAEFASWGSCVGGRGGALLMGGCGFGKYGEGTTLQTMNENEGECNNTAEKRVLSSHSDM